MTPHGTTLVLDIGKSNAKVALISAAGRVLRSTAIANESVFDPLHGYLGLGVERLQAWLTESIAGLVDGEVPARIAVTTHGAAFCAIDDDGLVLPPIDYEWDGYGEVTAAFDASLANFRHHGTPLLGQGLNGGRQIDYVHRRWPELAGRIRHWMPYAQYWSWWLSGIACTEVSSLGCHTGLWSPAADDYSDWAVARGIASRFAPLRRAWEVIGTLRPGLARSWGLPSGIEVIAGVHDSNACLARYLPEHPVAFVVSTGTWCIAMAPGTPAARLSADRDELVNVAVDGRAVPTARFMGGREFSVLCAGSDPAWATTDALSEVLEAGWMALPAFVGGSGPFRDRLGSILRGDRVVAEGTAAIPERLRPAVAALYCANLTQLVLEDLAGTEGAALQAPVILEGPLARNPAYLAALSAILRPRAVHRSVDTLEGTARGLWQLAWWNEGSAVPDDLLLQPVTSGDAEFERLLRSEVRRFHAGVKDDPCDRLPPVSTAED